MPAADVPRGSSQLGINVQSIVTVKAEIIKMRADFVDEGIRLRIGERCVFPSDRGVELGQVVEVRPAPEGGVPSDLPRALRRASERDLYLYERRKDREDAAYRFCRKRIAARRMPMKLSQVEYIFDGSRVIFYFTADGRIDFRELVKDLAREFRTRIEMRQIGARDEAKLMGAVGCCGIGENCSARFLKELKSVSVKTAKAQDLAINPSRLSGICGRLKCCLNYESEVAVGCADLQGSSSLGEALP